MKTIHYLCLAFLLCGGCHAKPVASPQPVPLAVPVTIEPQTPMEKLAGSWTRDDSFPAQNNTIIKTTYVLNTDGTGMWIEKMHSDIREHAQQKPLRWKADDKQFTFLNADNPAPIGYELLMTGELTLHFSPGHDEIFHR